MRTILVVISLVFASAPLFATEPVATKPPENSSIKSSTEVALNQGKAYMKLGQYTDAIQVYSNLLAKNPFNAVAANNLALAHVATGNYKVALKLLEKAVRLVPNRKDITANLTRIHEWMEKHSEAESYSHDQAKLINYATLAPPKPW